VTDETCDAAAPADDDVDVDEKSLAFSTSTSTSFSSLIYVLPFPFHIPDLARSPSRYLFPMCLLKTCVFLCKQKHFLRGQKINKSGRKLLSPAT